MEEATAIEDVVEEPKLEKNNTTDLLHTVGFRLMDLYLNDFHQMKKKPTQFDADNPTYNSNDVERSVEATMDCDDAVYGITCNAKFTKIAKLVGLDGYLFHGVPFKSPLFIFSIIGRLHYKDAYDHKKFVCDYVAWKPIDFILSTATSILNIIGVETETEDFDFVSFLFETHTKGDDLNQLLQTKQSDNILIDRDKFIYWLQENFPKEFAVMSGINEYKRFFLAKEFALLCHRFTTKVDDVNEDVIEPLYSEDVITNMTWNNIKKLYDVITTKPHLMAYVQLITLKYYVTESMKKENKSSSQDVMPIPELSLSNVLNITNKMFPNKTETTLVDLCALNIYQVLKLQATNAKHSYVPFSSIIEMIDRNYISDSSCVYMALQYLVTNGIVYASDRNDISISYIYEWEKAIVLSFDRILSNKDNLKPIPIYIENATTTGGFELCDEQKNALSIISKNPITLIQGRAGSGKTDMLNALAKNVNPRKTLTICKGMLATAFMGINVAQLRRVFERTSFTGHQLLHAHNKYCSRSPFITYDTHGNRNKSSIIEQKKGVTAMVKSERCCIFEDVEWVIVEEMSTQDLALFATLLAAIVRCGKVKRVIMLGDIKQCPSIRLGRIMGDITDFCEKLGTLCIFNHDHRTGKANKILKRNIDSILGLSNKSIQFDDEFCIHIDISGVAENQKIGYINDKITSLLTKWDIKEHEHHIITRVNSVKDSIIRVIEEFFHNSDPKTNILGAYTGRGLTYHRKIAFNTNRHEDDIINNEIVFIENIEDEMEDSISKKKIVKIRDNTSIPIQSGTTRYITFSTIDKQKKIRVEWSEWIRNHIKKASASTVQSFQGSQSHTIFYVLPESKHYDTLENVVTAWTRSTYRVIYIGTLSDLYKSIKNPEPARRSKLSEMLLEFYLRYKYQNRIQVETEVAKQIPPTIELGISQITLEEKESTEPDMGDIKSASILNHVKKMMMEKAKEIPQVIVPIKQNEQPIVEQPSEIIPLPQDNIKLKKNTQIATYRTIPHKPGLQQLLTHTTLAEFLKVCVRNEIIETRHAFDLFDFTSSSGNEENVAIIAAAKKFLDSSNTQEFETSKMNFYYAGILRTLNIDAESTWNLTKNTNIEPIPAIKSIGNLEDKTQITDIPTREETVQKKQVSSKKKTQEKKIQEKKKRKKEESSDDEKKKKKEKKGKREKKKEKKKPKKKSKHDSSSNGDGDSDGE